VQRVLPLFVLGLGLIGMPTLLVAHGGLTRLGQLESERKAVQVEISRLNKRMTELRADARALRSSPAAVERSARDELGLVRRTEFVFHFQPAEQR
jgi:cell division protein FtsB